MRGNMKNMMKQMQQMQKEMQKSQGELEATEFTGVANDDLVKVTMTGKREVLSVEIKEDIIDPEEKEIIEDLVMIAMNDALSQIDEQTEKVMGKYTNNLNIPGF